MSGGGSKPGERRGGRQRGTPNKLTSDVKAMTLGALNAKGGQEWLEQQMDDNLSAFMTLIGKVLRYKGFDVASVWLPLQVSGAYRLVSRLPFFWRSSRHCVNAKVKKSIPFRSSRLSRIFAATQASASSAI